MTDKRLFVIDIGHGSQFTIGGSDGGRADAEFAGEAVALETGLSKETVGVAGSGRVGDDSKDLTAVGCGCSAGGVQPGGGGADAAPGRQPGGGPRSSSSSS